jgi:four helix bundle protein
MPVRSAECGVRRKKKNMGQINSFKELEIWKKGIEIVKMVYQLTSTFPKTEDYGLSSPMRRCAVSVPSNIAEGFRRNGKKEFRQFLNIALGSLAELETQLIIAKEINYLDGQNLDTLFSSIEVLNRMTVSLSKKLK